MKNQLVFAFVIIVTLLSSCSKDDDTSSSNSPVKQPALNISASESGVIYLDGRFTGYKMPRKLYMSKGKHIIGVALDASGKYLRKEVEVVGDADLQLVSADQPQPKVWKALWVGLHEVTGDSPTGRGNSRFSTEELNAGFDFFQWSIKKHFEKYSYGTMKWEVVRKDITAPVELCKESNSWFTVQPSAIASILPEIKPGEYDVVFVFWRESEGAINFKSNYLGLGWTDPMYEPIKTGFVTVKFDAGTNINERIAYFKNTDPGVWVHEWLHTVGERYFQSRGKQLPINGNGLIVHAAEKYSYTFPWLNWYEDFISGRVHESGGLLA